MAQIGVNIVKGLIMVIILTVIVFTVLNETAADVGGAAGNLSATGGDADTTYPLMSFFKKKGVLLLSMIAGVIIVLVVSYLSFGGNK